MRTKHLTARVQLDGVFRAWRLAIERGDDASLDAARVRLSRLRIASARLGKVLRHFSLALKESIKKDEAAFVRNMYSQARGEGTASLHDLLRAVLKTGRRYRPPQLSPCLQTSHGLVADPKEARVALGKHFAAAEKALRSPSNRYNVARVSCKIMTLLKLMACQLFRSWQRHSRPCAADGHRGSLASRQMCSNNALLPRRDCTRPCT